MTDEIFSLAVLEALPEKADELNTTLREFYTLMHSKGYSRDALYRDCNSSRSLCAPALLGFSGDAR